jgi:ABC-type transport system involved in multi-copper enzyme maturation permease subunit
MSDAPPALPRLPAAGLVGPILGWELTTLARRTRYFMVRAAYAALLGGVMWMTYESSFRWNVFNRTVLQQSASFASTFFYAFIGVQLFVSALLTPAFVATAVPQEKERKTIEYLFVSDLRNREIVLGKLLARVTNLLMILLVGVPIIALAGLFGGIDYEGLLINTVATMMVTLTIASLSLLVSIYCSTTRQSLFNTYGILIFGSILLPQLVYLGVVLLGRVLEPIGLGWDFFSFPPWVSQGLAIASLAHPASPIFLLNWQFVGPNPVLNALGASLLHVGIHATLSAGMIAWSIYWLRRAYRFEPARPMKVKENIRYFKDRFLWSRPAVWESSPHVWKEVHATKLKRFGIIIRILLIVGFLYYYGLFFDEWRQSRLPGFSMRNDGVRAMGSMCSVAWMGLAYLTIAFRAASSIGEEKDRDCWISLLATPITGRELILSKVFGSFLSIVPYVLIQLPVLLYCAFISPWGIVRLGYWLAAASIFGLLVASFGVHQSLTQKSTGRAIGMTLFASAALGGLGQIFLIPLVFASEELASLVLASLPWTPLAMAFVATLNEAFVRQMLVFSIVLMVVAGVATSILIADAIRRFPMISERLEE